jgi:hypothetical protein
MLRPTVSRSVCLDIKHPSGAYNKIFIAVRQLAGLLMWGGLSDERMGIPFTIAAGPRQRIHSWDRVPRDSWPYFAVSDSRLPQSRGPGPRIYIPQEQDGPVIAPGTGFPFHRLLRLAGVRWKYLTPPPHGICKCVLYSLAFIFYSLTADRCILTKVIALQISRLTK